jgi:hypothetical protein
MDHLNAHNGMILLAMEKIPGNYLRNGKSF